jgi:sugar phosphate isomerase/epimerase
MQIPIITAEPKTEHLDLVNSLAKEYQIKVAIHDHPKPSLYWHPDSVYAAIKNRPYIGVCADIGHWVRNGLNVLACLKKLEGRIMVLHLKDVIKNPNYRTSSFNGDAEEYIDTRLGQGVCNIPAVLRELKKQKFSGLFSMEHETNWENNVSDLLYNKAFYYSELKKIVAK